MSFVSDLKVLYHLALSPIRGHSHQERLESFYRGQADAYDSFRAHLLKGRRELYELLPVPEGGVWVEMGGGTGANLEHLGERISRLGHVYLVDLCAPLLDVARRRTMERGWHNVEAVHADVTTFTPPRPVDVLTFSYSLTMIPDWFAALEQAERLLRPGGTLGVVDFYVARKYPDQGRQRHAWLTRAFWPVWLGLDNVFPSPDHVPYLHRHFAVQQFSEHRTRMRYFPIARVPYYRFVGLKRTY
jgi:S-adenosylmethionine-diacylgycerolhomoserine-N-methlytransferase